MNYNIVNAQRAMFSSGRGLLDLYFILPGISKIIDFSGMSEYMAAHGVAFVHVLLVFTIILQIVCGVSLVAGVTP
jgi:putative oxidoreductase